MFTSLANVIARKTPVQWFEGVAIVQSLARQLDEKAAAARGGLPDLDDVVLTSEGDVVVTRTNPGAGDPVRDLGRLLDILVPAASMPPQLRRVVVKAVAPSPEYLDIKELMQALLFFERPDLREPVRAVYERWVLLPPQESEPVPVQAAAPTRAPVPPPAAWKRRAGLAAAAASAIVLLGVPSSCVSGGADWGASARKESVAAVAARKVGQAASTAVGALRRAIGRRDQASPAPASVPAASEPPVQADASETPAPPRRRRVRTSRPAPLKADAVAAAIPPAAVVPDAGPDDTIYSADSPDVTPPVPIRALQRSEPPEGVRAEDLPTVEVLVSASGEVESVRLLRTSRQPLASSALSVVKAWRFHPATRNGRPVRYKQTIRLTGG